MRIELVSTSAQYFGKVCLKHPELNGERRPKNKDCVGCHREQAHKKHLLKMMDAEYNRKFKEKKNLKRKIKRDLDEAYKKREYDRRNEWRRQQFEDPVKLAKARAYTQHRNRNTLMAKPPWVSWDDIAVIYKEAKARGMTVDHIIPIKHPRVCGLHVPWNMQLMTMEENRSKGNKFYEE